MAGVKKTAKKLGKKSELRRKLLPNPFKKGEFERSHANPAKVLEDTGDDLEGAFTPDIPVPEEDPLIPLPTASTAANEARKRRAKSKTSGRQSTILTEGLGG